MTTTAAPELEIYDVVFIDDLGAQSTSVIATCHDDAADQLAYDGASILTTTRRRDGDEIDHTFAATHALAGAIAGPDGTVIDAGDFWLITAA